MKRILGFLLALLCVTSCHWFDPVQKDRHALLVFFSGNNSLSGYGTEDLQNFMDAYLPTARDKENYVMVYYHFTDQTPTLSRLYKDRQGQTVEETSKTYPFSTNSASAATLETVIRDAEQAYPAEHHGMILWSHATGFLPAGYYNNPLESIKGESMMSVEADPYAFMVKSSEPDSKSFAEDHGSEMELLDLQRALSNFHYDYLIFDCCLMANIEVAYQLRDCCDYLLLSPTEILADGLPYGEITQPLLTLPPEEALRLIGEKYMSYYRGFSGAYRSATITLVKTQEMQRLATACRQIFKDRSDAIMTLDRSKVQPYFRNGWHWYYDLDDFVSQLADGDEYVEFVRALSDVVVYKDATEHFIDVDIKKNSGLSIYIPRPGYTVLNNYYKTLAWNKATGLIP